MVKKERKHLIADVFVPKSAGCCNFRCDFPIVVSERRTHGRTRKNASHWRLQISADQEVYDAHVMEEY